MAIRGLGKLCLKASDPLKIWWGLSGYFLSIIDKPKVRSRPKLQRLHQLVSKDARSPSFERQVFLVDQGHAFR